MSTIMEVGERKERPPYVRFEQVAVEDKVASRLHGHYVGKDVDMANVTPPYSKDVFKIEVNRWFQNLEQDVQNQRMPQEWLQKYHEMYKLWKSGQEIPLDGTPIKGWGVLSPAQQKLLIDMNIRTVEDLALVNDEGMKRIGMGANDLKNKANGWLSQLKDKGPLTQEIAAVKAENITLRTSVETLTKQVEALIAQVRVNTQATVTKIETQPEGGISFSDIVEDVPPIQKVEKKVEDPKVAYEKKFGKPPHHRMKIETIEAALRG